MTSTDPAVLAARAAYDEALASGIGENEAYRAAGRAALEYLAAHPDPQAEALAASLWAELGLDGRS
jgi:hypothetical protein